MMRPRAIARGPESARAPAGSKRKPLRSPFIQHIEVPVTARSGAASHAAPAPLYMRRSELSHYQAIAHRIGSPGAVELGRRLSSWHDRMVAHERLARSSRQRCDDACPHAESIELWQGASEVLGEAAERLTFLKTTAANAEVSATRGETVEQQRTIAVGAR